MLRSLSYRSSVRRFFHSGFSAQDIAQSLISYHAPRPAPEIQARMVLSALRVARQCGSMGLSHWWRR